MSNPDRIHLARALITGPGLLVLWFFVLVLVALISIGMLLEGILHAQEPGFRICCYAHG